MVTVRFLDHSKFVAVLTHFCCISYIHVLVLLLSFDLCNRLSVVMCLMPNLLYQRDQSVEFDYIEQCDLDRCHLLASTLSVPQGPMLLLLFAPLPSNRHHRSSGDCLEGKGENYQVCSVQYCVQQLCTVRCTHI